MESGINLIAYADDLAIAIRNKTSKGLKEAAEYAAIKIAEKLEEMGLDVALNKTEALILVGRRSL